jgi:hypothetical protein
MRLFYPALFKAYLIIVKSPALWMEPDISWFKSKFDGITVAEEIKSFGSLSLIPIVAKDIPFNENKTKNTVIEIETIVLLNLNIAITS